MFFHFFVILFNFLHKLSIVFSIQIFTSLVRFIYRYFMLLGAIVNGISFVFCIYVTSLLVYKNATDFCTLILYPVTLLNSCISFSRLLVSLTGFPCIVSCHLQKVKAWLHHSQFWCLWFPFVVCDARTSNTMLNNSGESGHPCRVPDLRGKAVKIGRASCRERVFRSV